MANTTSGTAIFDKNFSIDEIIEEAYERIGMQGVSGNQLRTALKNNCRRDLERSKKVEPIGRKRL
jgi:hypothetical protein